MIILKIIEAFKAFKVDYAFSGALAANLNGILLDDPEIEIIIPNTLDQFKKLEKALTKAGYTNTLPVGAEELFYFREQFQSEKNLKRWVFENPKLPTEKIIIPFDVEPSGFSLQEISVKGQSVKFLKPTDLTCKIPEDTPQVQNVEPGFLLQRLENLRFYQHLEQRKELGKSKLISMKVPMPLLEAFRHKSQMLGVPYQTQIKYLMKDWLK